MSLATSISIHSQKEVTIRTFGKSRPTMTALEVRSELKDLIDRIRDLSVLDALHTLALRQVEQDDMTADMERMADLSEEAIARGEVSSRAEVEQWLKEHRPKT